MSISNLSSMALVWLAYTCWGVSCVHFFARSTRGTCTQISTPTRTNVGCMTSAAVGGALAAAATTAGRTVALQLASALLAALAVGCPRPRWLSRIRTLWLAVHGGRKRRRRWQRGRGMSLSKLVRCGLLSGIMGRGGRRRRAPEAPSPASTDPFCRSPARRHRCCEARGRGVDALVSVVVSFSSFYLAEGGGGRGRRMHSFFFEGGRLAIQRIGGAAGVGSVIGGRRRY